MYVSNLALIRKISTTDGIDHEETTIPYESYSTDDTADTDEERYVKDVIQSVQRYLES